MLGKIAPALVLVLVAGSVSATTITGSFTFNASGNSTAGDPISAQAVFTLFSNNTMTLQLTNKLVNPSSVAQNITDFDFQLLNSLGQNITPGCTTATCLTSANAPSRVVVASNGSFTTLNGPEDPKWAFSLSSGVFLLDGLSGAHTPAFSIIGPPGGATYSAAGGSIAGNVPHNPFINQSATWTFTIPNLATVVTPAHIVFSFGTVGGDTFSCDNHGGCGAGGGGGGGQAVPEPLSFALVGGGLIGMYFIRRRRPR